MRLALPLTKAVLRGWAKKEHPLSRPPLPREVALALATQICISGDLVAGFGAILAFETHLRVS